MMTTGLLMVNKMQNNGYGCIISVIKIDLKNSKRTSRAERYADSKECVWRTCLFLSSVVALYKLHDTDLFRSLLLLSFSIHFPNLIDPEYLLPY